MEHKFKVGDSVEVVNPGKNYTTYATWKGLDDFNAHWKYGNEATKGQRGTIVTLAPHSAGDHKTLALIRIRDKYVIIGAEGLELIDRGRVTPAPKFILQYDLDSDLFELFSTEKELRARIAELAARPDLKRESIKVYDIKRVRSVSLGVKITISK